MKLFFVFIFLAFFCFSSKAQSFIDMRDSLVYNIVEIQTLYWMRSNLRYKIDPSQTVSDKTNIYSCGEFYLVKESFKVCPKDWRLPYEFEVKRLLSLNRNGTINLNDTLQIGLCGRSDNGNHDKQGEQSTFWLDTELIDGSVSHWHVFNQEHDIHFHNVVNAARRFPIRCVKEVRK